VTFPHAGPREDQVTRRDPGRRARSCRPRRFPCDRRGATRASWPLKAWSNRAIIGRGTGRTSTHCRVGIMSPAPTCCVTRRQVKVMREADRMPANFGAATAHQPRPTGAGPERGACHRGLPRLAAHLRQLARPTPVAAVAVGAPVAGDDCRRGSPAFRDRDCRVSPEDGGRRGPEASSQPWYRYGVLSTQERAAVTGNWSQYVEHDIVGLLCADDALVELGTLPGEP
jgi:hypothetical protein